MLVKSDYDIRHESFWVLIWLGDAIDLEFLGRCHPDFSFCREESVQILLSRQTLEVACYLQA